MANFFYIVNILIFSYFELLTICYTILFIAALPDIITKYKEGLYSNIPSLMKLVELPPLTALVPMFNEGKRIINCVESILKSDYKNINIILLNDASTDNTIELLIQKYALKEVPIVIKQTLKTSKVLHVYKSTTYPITLIDKEHGHSADSLNVGLNACQTPLYMTIDADTVVEHNAITEMVYAMLCRPHCIAVGGALYVLNDNKVVEGVLQERKIPKTLLPAAQSLEYLRSFLFGRSGWNLYGGALCYAGAFTLFEKQPVMDLGGYDPKNFSYDVDILLGLHRWMRSHGYPYRVHYTPNPSAWTEVPQTFKSYWKQRERWQLGTIRSFLRHKQLFSPKYGITGLFAYPFNWLFEILGPVVEAFSYLFFIFAIYYGLVTFLPLMWAILLAWGYLCIISITIIILNNMTFEKYNKIYDTLKIFLLVVIELCGVRQFRAACALYSTTKYMVYPRSRHI